MKNYKRNLPHFNEPGAIYFVTFTTRHRFLLSPECRTIISEALCWYSGKRFRYFQSIVMPNHVHLLLQPIDLELRDIMRSIKGFTGFNISRELGVNGQIWERESFDRIIRDVHELEDTVLYIRENAVKAGLVDEWQKYPWYFEDLVTIFH